MNVGDKIYGYYLNDKYQVRCANYIILAIRDGVARLGLTPRASHIGNVIYASINKINNFKITRDIIYTTKRLSKEEKEKHSKLLYQFRVDELSQERDILKSELYCICKDIESIHKRFLSK